LHQTVRVELGSRSYDIRIGSGMASGGALAGAGRVLLVSDSNVAPLHADACERALAARGLTVRRCVIPAGEESKSLAQLSALYDAAVAAGLDRRGAMVALGGGVVGDLTGFAAATYLRGVPFVQVPTSLLAMVDSSVGGKTGINLPHGKNLVGAFYQPVEVTIDLNTLTTLPEREYRSGLAEVVKYGVIRDAAFFAELEAGVPRLLARDPALLGDVVARCCRIKAEVVASDETESGPRAILNFGHTLAHALETALGYGTWTHGEAVSAGMVYAAEVSVRQTGLPRESAARLRRLLAALGLPVDWRGEGAVSWEAARAVMARDKKACAGVVRFVLARGLGSVQYGCEVPEAVLRDVFADAPQG
jgi:3-dehydroquinate synthase